MWVYILYYKVDLSSSHQNVIWNSPFFTNNITKNALVGLMAFWLSLIKILSCYDPRYIVTVSYSHYNEPHRWCNG